MVHLADCVQNVYNKIMNKKPSQTVTIRLPIEVIELAKKKAAENGVNMNQFLSGIIIPALGCELIETGMMSRIMAETIVWMGQHGAKDAPVEQAKTTLKALKAMPPVSPAATAKKSSGAARKAKRR